ncbi:MAG: hypothetical protein Q8K26_00640 [Candidatus Gracilibacteria bacterium]|nr:hypothetical protein [Candidatus Gracilibacteria bacterium]
MDFSGYTFNYDPSNLGVFSYTFSLDNLILPAIVIAISIVYCMIYVLMPYLYGYVILSEQEKAKNEKRQVIKDLVLMNEIQTELEKEIEQSLLNVAMTK